MHCAGLVPLPAHRGDPGHGVIAREILDVGLPGCGCERPETLAVGCIGLALAVLFYLSEVLGDAVRERTLGPGSRCHGRLATSEAKLSILQLPTLTDQSHFSQRRVGADGGPDTFPVPGDAEMVGAGHLHLATSADHIAWANVAVRQQCGSLVRVRASLNARSNVELHG